VKERFIEHAALCSACVSILIIIAWFAGWATFTRVIPEAPCMVLDTALGFLHVSLGLWLAQRKSLAPLRFVAALLALLGAMNLFIRRPEIALHGYIFPKTASAPWSTAPQMAEASAASFLLVGLGLFLLSSRNPGLRTFRLVALLGTVVVTLGLVTLLAYIAGLYSAPWWSGTFLFRVSVLTGCLMCVTGAALIGFFWRAASVHPHQLSVTAATLAILCLLLIFAGVDAAVWASSSSMLAIRAEALAVTEQVAAVNALLLDMDRAESAQRGYLLTRREDFLTGFAAARGRIEDVLRSGAIHDAALLNTARLKLDELLLTIGFEKRGRHEEALRVLNERVGARLLALVVERAAANIAVLRSGQARRREQRLRSITTVRKSVLWSFGMAVLLALCAIRLAYAEIGRRILIEDSLAGMNEKLREQTARAEEANKAKSSFLASMSHEIRTPMTAILGMAEVLSESQLSPSQRQYVDIFRRAGSRLLNIINGILDLSKVEAGGLALESTPFDVRECIQQVIETLGPKAEAKDLRLNALIGLGVPTRVVGDPGRLEQVLFNLIGNAIKFTAQGHVTLSLTIEPSTSGAARHHFEVSDTGIGIDAEQLPHIFDDFKQAESSTARRFGGTGLGLSISRRLVSLMGGDLQARSELGHGSTFWFDVVLPIAAPGETVAPAASLAALAAALPRPASAPRRRRILIAEDSEDNRLLLEAFSRGSDYDLTFATDGRQAVDAYQSGAFETVILDVHMPVMDGLAAAEQIRLIEANSGRRRVPILALTASALQEDIGRTAAAGCDAHLTKPISKQAFLSALAEWRDRSPDAALSETQPAM
jgi:signal transduction histidine kinase/CheY-like chemotaxis protein